MYRICKGLYPTAIGSKLINSACYMGAKKTDVPRIFVFMVHRSETGLFQGFGQLLSERYEGKTVRA